MITIRGLKYVKWWEDPKSGRQIQIAWHMTPFLAKQNSKIGQLRISSMSEFFFVKKG